jgi:hypothetical protein
MTQVITLPDDLRHTAVTVLSAELAASGARLSLAAIEAGLDAATPYLVDAFLISEALAAADERAGDPRSHLQLLQRKGALPLRTLSLERGDADSDDA